MLLSIVQIRKIFHSLGLTGSLPLCPEFTPARPAPRSHEEVSRGVVWAFSSVVSFEINRTRIARPRGRGEVGGVRGEDREAATETERPSFETGVFSDSSLEECSWLIVCPKSGSRRWICTFLQLCLKDRGSKAEGPPGGAKERLVSNEAHRRLAYLGKKLVLEKSLLFIS